MTFRFEKFTIKAQEAVSRAQGIATQEGHPQMEAIHLLAGLLQEEDGLVKPILEKIGTNIQQLRGTIQSELGHLPKSSGGSAPPVGQGLAKVLSGAQEAASRMKDEFVSTEHLLLALTKVDSKAKNLLELNGIREKDLLTALRTTEAAREQAISVSIDPTPEGDGIEGHPTDDPLAVFGEGDDRRRRACRSVGPRRVSRDRRVDPGRRGPGRSGDRWQHQCHWRARRRSNRRDH